MTESREDGYRERYEALCQRLESMTPEEQAAQGERMRIHDAARSAHRYQEELKLADARNRMNASGLKFRG